MAKVIDSILEFRSEELGLYDVTTGKLAEKTSTMDIDTLYPQYDYLKRLSDLAKTTFYVFIEYNGKEWLRDRNLEDFERAQEENLKFYKNLYTHTISRERKRRLIDLIKDFPASTVEQYKDVCLFEKKSQIDKYLAGRLRWYEEQKHIPDLIKKVHHSNLFEVKRIHLYQLKINKENTKKFLDSIFEDQPI